jgi:hypothetical protein
MLLQLFGGTLQGSPIPLWGQITTEPYAEAIASDESNSATAKRVFHVMIFWVQDYDIKHVFVSFHKSLVYTLETY